MDKQQKMGEHVEENGLDTAWTVNDVLVDPYPFIALKGCGSTKMIKGYGSTKDIIDGPRCTCLRELNMSFFTKD